MLHRICHVGYEWAKNNPAFSPRQVNKLHAPCFFKPNVHVLWIHPSFLLGWNYNSMFVVDIWNRFSLDDYHQLKFWTISIAREYDCHSILLISCFADFDRFLTQVVDMSGVSSTLAMICNGCSLWISMMKQWNWTIFPSQSSGRCCAKVVFCWSERPFLFINRWHQWYPALKSPLGMPYL